MRSVDITNLSLAALPSRILAAVLATTLAAAGWQLGQAGWISLKALLAQQLLEHAWSRTRLNAVGIRPWPWADTWPVARLRVPGLGIDRIVLAGDSGSTLAFGPGHSFASSKPGNHGTVMISGHRDTHFRFLQHLEAGHRIVLQTVAGDYHYSVRRARVVDSKHYRPSTANERGLLLVTCYPFETLRPGGDLRYLVHAVQLPGTAGGFDTESFTD